MEKARTSRTSVSFTMSVDQHEAVLSEALMADSSPKANGATSDGCEPVSDLSTLPVDVPTEEDVVDDGDCKTVPANTDSTKAVDQNGAVLSEEFVADAPSKTTVVTDEGFEPVA